MRRQAESRDRGLVGWFQGLTSVAVSVSVSMGVSGQAGAETAAGWAKVENQEDMADLALVNAPPTD